MNANDVIESYVTEVALQLPRKQRNDVAFELRALLDEELAARARAAGRAPDKAMAMALLREFGRPSEAAQRYHDRPALIDAADTHHFLIWAVGGAVVFAVHAQVTSEPFRLDAALLQWLGALLLFFALAGWLRRRSPGRFAWKPGHGPDWMPRALSAFSLAALLAFPVFMYAAPVTFARLLMPPAVPVDGLALTGAFAGSWQRGLTMALLLVLALQEVITLVLGARRWWLRRAGVALSLALATMFFAHASPMQAFGGGTPFAVFRSAHANAVAAPLFMAVGGMMLLFGLYYAWRTWGEIRPEPAPPARASA